MSTLAVRPRWPLALCVEAAAAAGRRLRHLRRAPGRFLGITLNPLVSMLILGYLFQHSITVPGAGSYQEYLFAGAAAQVGLAGIGPSAIAVAGDRDRGLVDRLRSLPIDRGAVLIGHTLADAVVGVLGLAVVTAFGLLIGWRPHGDPLSTVAAFALLALFGYVMSWVGVLLGMTSRNAESISALAPLVTVVLPFLSNAFLSSASLPGWLTPIADWNPVSAVSSACRALWANPSGTATSFAGTHPGVVLAAWLGPLLVVSAGLSLRRYRATG
ncbi:ABC transporter permease [Kutzneria buriramensis]|uniref:Transport permease protein n=1 Tax=Kutzneria buriramensis TaxID=1045776 RepID=A0A3E0HQH6_9PSEU|nr:ABC transporter permease [Kutzneria buriramensis]REH48496.1 ABC transporter DrrB family efflux protein [Kutzneria buriramensis]